MRWTAKFVVALFICFLSFSLGAFAKRWKIAILNQEGPPSLYDQMVTGFKQGLEVSGFKAGKDIKYIHEETFTADTTGGEAAADAVLKLLDKGVDLVFTVSDAPTVGARKVLMRSSIPQIYCGSSDPVGFGLVSARDVASGSNVTGVNYYVDPSDELALARKILPEAKTYSFLCDSTVQADLQRKAMFEALAGTPGAHGFTMKYFDISSEEGRQAFSQSTDIDSGSGWTGYVVLQNRGITIPEPANYISVGVGIKEVMQYPRSVGICPDHTIMGQQAAVMAAKIINGEEVIGKIPAEDPKKTVIMVNMDSARRTGITIPFEILTEAEKIMASELDSE